MNKNGGEKCFASIFIDQNSSCSAGNAQLLFIAQSATGIGQEHVGQARTTNANFLDMKRGLCGQTDNLGQPAIAVVHTDLKLINSVIELVAGDCRHIVLVFRAVHKRI